MAHSIDRSAQKSQQQVSSFKAYSGFVYNDIRMPTGTYRTVCRPRPIRCRLASSYSVVCIANIKGWVLKYVYSMVYHNVHSLLNLFSFLFLQRDATHTSNTWNTSKIISRLISLRYMYVLELT